MTELGEHREVTITNRASPGTGRGGGVREEKGLPGMYIVEVRAMSAKETIIDKKKIL